MGEVSESIRASARTSANRVRQQVVENLWVTLYGAQVDMSDRTGRPHYVLGRSPASKGGERCIGDSVTSYRLVERCTGGTVSPC